MRIEVIVAVMMGYYKSLKDRELINYEVVTFRKKNHHSNGNGLSMQVVRTA